MGPSPITGGPASDGGARRGLAGGLTGGESGGADAGTAAPIDTGPGAGTDRPSSVTVPHWPQKRELSASGWPHWGQLLEPIAFKHSTTRAACDLLYVSPCKTVGL